MIVCSSGSDKLRRHADSPLYFYRGDLGLQRLPWDELDLYGGDYLFFDDSMDWIIIHHHQETVTFGGDGLVERVRELSRGRVNVEG